MSAQSPQVRQPPATPTYILRGHAAAIHALQIFHQNLRLVSGDADGWIVVWDLVFKRPLAVWKAHDGAVLEVKGFSFRNGAVTEVFTHGRDHKLRAWRFSIQDEEILQKTLPVDYTPTSSAAPQPWLVHSLPVNALNFCAFSMVFLPPSKSDTESGTPEAPSESKSLSSALIAVPNALDSGAIDLFHLPQERRICTIPADMETKTGMVMAANLVLSASGELYVASAYEDGHVMVLGCRGPLYEKDLAKNAKTSWKWEKLYVCRAHSQPALSIHVSPAGDYFFSSSADAVLAKHPIPVLGAAGYREETPIKSINTKHAGQQGVRIRSDGKIFATAGWDSRVRVYSCKTMKELAVLKWHKDGCYAVGFADVAGLESEASTGETTTPQGGDDKVDTQLTTRAEFSLATVHRQRNQKVQNTHWLAAGSKDGKISLWDIY
ncbi:WD repeat protein [Aspergillus sclerotioniger CBS 115572]|uniref:ASTRA-associated protein 1 n=1 Tax=Aspergillus sclerotioniger CBS 115572 TaxID=1450535 RepID=A0A317XB84_9EURO|nr:WD repeat protein [Aspergillus sclerotioniger CBS 115572]PWY95894.1 WD repeat protein [Aspergillus sclerotioniger CBS 115572]